MKLVKAESVTINSWLDKLNIVIHDMRESGVDSSLSSSIPLQILLLLTFGWFLLQIIVLSCFLLEKTTLWFHRRAIRKKENSRYREFIPGSTPVFIIMSSILFILLSFVWYLGVSNYYSSDKSVFRGYYEGEMVVDRIEGSEVWSGLHSDERIAIVKDDSRNSKQEHNKYYDTDFKYSLKDIPDLKAGDIIKVTTGVKYFDSGSRRKITGSEELESLFHNDGYIIEKN